MKYSKIAIIGISGSGKTTLSNTISSITGLPVFHVDRLFWMENGEPVSKTNFTIKHNEIISKDKWIIEGYLEKSMVERVNRSEKIIYLDYSRFIVLIRFIKRWIGNKKRDDLILPEESFIGFLIKVFIETIVMAERSKIENSIKDIDPQKIIRIKTPKMIDSILKEQFCDRVSETKQMP